VYDRDTYSNMNLVLLDEPDSYIHRNIQIRLMAILELHANKSQIFIATHNEGMIRAAATQHLFHLEAKTENIYYPLDTQQLTPLTKTGDKRFKGIYPSPINVVIRSLGNSTGLDFINAIESDKILFVEGEDDAQALYMLLQQAVIPKNTKKYVFWVMNGITNIFKEVNMYKTLFSQIKNEKSLWDKSALIMDRDFLSDEHAFGIAKKMKEKLRLPTYIMDAYTLETSLLTDFKKLSRLLAKWVDNKYDEKIDSYNLEKQIDTAYQGMKSVLEAKYLNDYWKVGVTQRYIEVREKTNLLFGKGHNVIDQNDTKLTLYYQKYLEDCIQRYDFYKLMNKYEVQQVINNALSTYNYTFDIEKDFIFLLAGVDRATWMSAWDFLIELSR
jgi:energy-coupling factor transporter ATP-binding protein EcfA2